MPQVMGKLWAYIGRMMMSHDKLWRFGVLIVKTAPYGCEAFSTWAVENCWMIPVCSDAESPRYGDVRGEFVDWVTCFHRPPETHEWFLQCVGISTCCIHISSFYKVEDDWGASCPTVISSVCVNTEYLKNPMIMLKLICPICCHFQTSLYENVWITLVLMVEALHSKLAAKIPRHTPAIIFIL